MTLPGLCSLIKARSLFSTVSFIFNLLKSLIMRVFLVISHVIMTGVRVMTVVAVLLLHFKILIIGTAVASSATCPLSPPSLSNAVGKTQTRIDFSLPSFIQACKWVSFLPLFLRLIRLGVRCHSSLYLRRFRIVSCYICLFFVNILLIAAARSAKILLRSIPMEFHRNSIRREKPFCALIFC